MSATLSTDDRYAASMARAQQRVAQISTSVPSVIERISSPVISPQAYAAPAVPVSTPKQAVQVPAETVDANPLPTKDAQMAALSAMGLLGMKTRADDVLLVIATACRAGVDDLTGREIQTLYERRYGRRIESGTISARVSELLTAQRILRRPQTRICTVTREIAAPVYVVMKQTRMVW